MSQQSHTGMENTAGGKKIFLASTEQFVDAKPEKEISDQDLQFLQSLKPDVPLADLRAHVLNNYAKGMSADGLKFRCFQSLYYLLPAITDHFLYSGLIEGPSKGLFLELGGGQGTDARKLVQDGWPATNIVSSDITRFLWDVGLHLFEDGPTGPVCFKEANILDAADTQPGGALHDYHGKADVVYAQAVLHLFNEETVKTYCKAALSFVKPGGIFMGAQSGSDPPGHFGTPADGNMALAPWMYSPSGFKQVLEGMGLVDVRMDTYPFTEMLRRRGFGKDIWDIDITDPFGDGKRELMWVTWSARKPAASS